MSGTFALAVTSDTLSQCDIEDLEVPVRNVKDSLITLVVWVLIHLRKSRWFDSLQFLSSCR